MSRIISFRGKRIDNGNWVYGGSIVQAKSVGEDFLMILPSKTRCVGLSSMSALFKRVDPATVGQFTGLRDRNGKEIYEGDILELVNADYDTIRVVCEFGNARRIIFGNEVDITGFYFKLPNGKKSFPIVKNYLGKHDLEIFEIVGNVHDNPELLEVAP